MEFCDECGSMMKREDSVMVCSSCGYEAEQEGDSGDFISTTEQTGDELSESSDDANYEGRSWDAGCCWSIIVAVDRE